MLKIIEFVILAVALLCFLGGAIVSLTTLPNFISPVLYLMCSIFFIITYVIQILIYIREK